MTPDDWLKLWWLPVGVVVAGGLILAGLMAIFSTTVRKRFWRPILRPFRWLAALRITTTSAQRSVLDELEAARADAVRISGVGVEEIVRLQSQVAAADAAGYQRGWAEGAAAGREEVEGRIKAERSVPLAHPAWRIDAVRSNEVYELRNAQPGVVVRDLSIEAPIGDFQFNGPKRWPDEFLEKVEFEGERMHNGKANGVKFTLRWRDVNGDWQLGEAWMDKEPRRAVVL